MHQALLEPELAAGLAGCGDRAAADAGFAVPAIYEHCEEQGMEYTIGLVNNSRLEALAAGLLSQAQRQYDATQQKVRLLSESVYRAG